MTAGTWTTINLLYVRSFGPGVKKPGEVVRRKMFAAASETSVTSSTFTDTSLSMTITPTSAANFIDVRIAGKLRNSNRNATSANLQLVRGSTAIGPEGAAQGSTGGVIATNVGTAWLDRPNTTSSTTYKMQINSSDNTTAVQFPRAPNGAPLLTLTMRAHSTAATVEAGTISSSATS